MGGFDYGWERLDLGLYEGVIEEDEQSEYGWGIFGKGNFEGVERVGKGEERGKGKGKGQGMGGLKEGMEDHVSLFYGARRESYKFVLTVIFGSVSCLVGDSYSMKHFFVEKAGEVEGSVIFGGCFAEIQNLIRKNSSKIAILDFLTTKAFGDGIFQENLIDFGKSLIVNGHH